MNLSDSSGRFRRAQRLPKDIECPSPVFGLDVGLNPTLLRLPLAPECLGNREVEAGAVAPALGGGYGHLQRTTEPVALSRVRGP